jgi:isoquinoline 1-oxidoreductase alpha subunit
MAFTIKINGESRTVDVDGEMPLLWVLRDVLDLKGAKFGCGMALCGACTVHIDGAATRSCITPISAVGASSVTTIEAMAKDPVGAKLQAAWIELDVPQCGYCQAGQIMSAAALLHETPKPTDAQIDEAMQGNLCRCAAYVRIRAGIKKAAGLSTEDTRV